MTDRTVNNRLSTSDEVSVILEEYRALYSLLTYRFSSIEKRVATAGILMSAVLGLLPTLPNESKIVFLFGAPLGLLYILRSTILHIRSLEDYFRLIEEAETRINKIAKKSLLRFQSGHPSKKTPGGRGSQELLSFILLMSIGILIACGYLFFHQIDTDWQRIIYMTFITCIGIYLVWTRIEFFEYRYTPTEVSSETAFGDSE